MGAPLLSPEHADRAQVVAREIGAAFRRARISHGHFQKHAARAAGIRRCVVTKFESGFEPNVKLGTVVKLLDLYGLTLQVCNDAHATAHARAESSVTMVSTMRNSL